MKSIKYLVLVACIAAFAGACTPMDDNYKEFVEDGPVTYLTKLKVEEVTIIGERNRAKVILPPLYDLRAKKVLVYWANKTRQTEEPINTGNETSFIIDELTEGTYIFEFVLIDDDDNKSLITPVTAEIYGDVYESYLMNRAVIGYDSTADIVTFAEVKESTMLHTVIEWSEGGEAKSVLVDTLTLELPFADFSAHSFRYRTAYRPGETDIFYSPYTYMLLSPEPAQVNYDRITKQFTFPDLSNDDHWAGYEMKWVDRHTMESKSFKVENRIYEFTIPGYESAEFSYTTLFRYGDVQAISTPTTKQTSQRAFLDRNSWYIPLETEKGTDRELVNVMDGAWTTAASAVAAKNKSPYLSQKLPWSSSSANDGLTNPRAHIDDNMLTYLSMVKGPGTSFEAGGSAHTNGGVASSDSDFGTEIYFIIDLGQQEEFDYFSILYRVNGSAVAALRPQKVMLFGSNDPDCITDQEKWEPITDGSIVLPKCSLATVANNYTHADNTTGNIQIPFSTYRYVKCRYTEWLATSNTMQITEFYLGGTVY
jgi:hypothetical protein